MSLQSAYDDILDDMQCIRCGHVGMEPDGGYSYYCPICGYEGSLSNDEDEEEESDTDDEDY